MLVFRGVFPYWKNVGKYTIQLGVWVIVMLKSAGHLVRHLDTKET